MGELAAEDYFAIVFILMIFLWGLSIILFGRITVKHIEKEMNKEGLLPPEWDKGIGMRYPGYAGIIIFPNLKRHTSTVNIEATKRFARKKDLYLALFMQISFAILMVLMIVWSFLYGPE